MIGDNIMQWTFDNYKHYSAEHMQKAEKHRLAQELDRNVEPRRREVLGKRRVVRHNL